MMLRKIKKGGKNMENIIYLPGPIKGIKGY
jgi:hypothetical protein